MGEPTTTSFAILALLALKPWTTYELAKQMERSLRDLWPRAESVVYEEPKRLVAYGFATASKRYTGRRATTLYSITPKGRRELVRWLQRPGAGPVQEFEGLVKVAFSDLSSRDDLLAQIRTIRAEAEARRAYVGSRLKEYESTGGPFRDRLPVINLVGRYQLEQARALGTWAAWAEAEVKRWRGVTPSTGARVPKVGLPRTADRPNRRGRSRVVP
jgi:DNA-binding PadR family transcriptional regulator